MQQFRKQAGQDFPLLCMEIIVGGTLYPWFLVDFDMTDRFCLAICLFLCNPWIWTVHFQVKSFQYCLFRRFWFQWKQTKEFESCEYAEKWLDEPNCKRKASWYTTARIWLWRGRDQVSIKYLTVEIQLWFWYWVNKCYSFSWAIDRSYSWIACLWFRELPSVRLCNARSQKNFGWNRRPLSDIWTGFYDQTVSRCAIRWRDGIDGYHKRVSDIHPPLAKNFGMRN
jgi:hypothetical protein